jgi:hypothetical protein
MKANSGHAITEKHQKIRLILFRILVPLPDESPETTMVTGFSLIWILNSVFPGIALEMMKI